MHVQAQARVQAQAHVQTHAQAQAQAQAKVQVHALGNGVSERGNHQAPPRTADENSAPRIFGVNSAPSRKTRRKRGMHKGQRDRLALRPTAKMNQH